MILLFVCPSLYVYRNNIYICIHCIAIAFYFLTTQFLRLFWKRTPPKKYTFAILRKNPPRALLFLIIDKGLQITITPPDLHLLLLFLLRFLYLLPKPFSVSHPLRSHSFLSRHTLFFPPDTLSLSYFSMRLLSASKSIVIHSAFGCTFVSSPPPPPHTHTPRLPLFKLLSSH